MQYYKCNKARTVIFVLLHLVFLLPTYEKGKRKKTSK